MAIKRKNQNIKKKIRTNTEDKMYENMTEEEKIKAMKLDENKLSKMFKCVEDFENTLKNLANEVSKGYMISKKN